MTGISLTLWLWPLSLYLDTCKAWAIKITCRSHNCINVLHKYSQGSWSVHYHLQWLHCCSWISFAGDLRQNYCVLLNCFTVCLDAHHHEDLSATFQSWNAILLHRGSGRLPDLSCQDVSCLLLLWGTTTGVLQLKRTSEIYCIGLFS